MKLMSAWTCGAVALCAAVVSQADPGQSHAVNEDDATPAGLLQRMTNLHQGLRAWNGPDGRLKRVYGVPVSMGDSPLASSQAWIDDWGGIWNLDAKSVVQGGVLPSGEVVLPLMLNDDGSTKFHAVYFTQTISGVPVFNGRLTLLTSNTNGHPVVMAAGDIRDLTGFEATIPSEALTSDNRVATLARTLVGQDGVVVGTPRTVVFAGYDNEAATPTMAIDFVAEAGSSNMPEGHVRYRFVVDVNSGDVLYEEDQILHCFHGHRTAARLAPALVSDVTGTVRANTTPGTAAAACDFTIYTPLPYARVTGGGDTLYTNAQGQFASSYSGGSTSFGGALDGIYFNMNNDAGSTTSASANGADGDAILINYNPSPTELVTAQVNAYLEANRIRDLVLQYAPSFPTIAGQTNFPINVNLGSTCNAFYDYSSINFYQSGGGCNNTAFSVVVHHEYGHHGVDSAGSGQGEYGEGYGDVWGVILTGDPKLARGFYSNDCENGIRNADNDCQYSASGCSSCGSAIHACGQLISGVVWDLMQNLGGFDDAAGMDIVRSVAINSMPLHSGTSIDADICIDYLVMDDNDGTIDNGTPNWSAITAAFDVHGIETPELAVLGLSLPDGLPNYLSTGGAGTAMALRIDDLAGSYQTGSGRMHYASGGGAWEMMPLTDIGGSLHEGVIPSADCGLSSSFYFSAQTTDGVTVLLPSGGEGAAYNRQHADGAPIITYEEDFQTNVGWESSGTAADGQWDFGVPVNCDRGDPPTDFDGNNRCALTDNSSADGCNSDVDDGTAVLTSPDLDASEPGSSVRYARWFSNDYGAAPNTDSLIVQASFNGGASWTGVEVIGPTGPEVSGGWFVHEVVLDTLSGYTPTDQFRLRFTTSDLASSGSVVEAAIDAITILSPNCDDEPACVGDLNGDGWVGADDILVVLAGWGTAGGDADGDGDTDVDDLLVVVGDYGCS